MNPPPAIPNDTSGGLRGFDSPVVSRNDDHLNRWPLAREVYGIATTGPKDWSVRIGIYGEWGTGKTSVLKLISSMAENAGHIAISFNPWEHSTKESLWRAFVLSIFGEPRLASIPGAFKAHTKRWLGGILKSAKVVESGTAILNEKVGKGVGAGLELVKSFFSFKEKDLKSLRDALGNRRVIILIDDLDRTAPELVPEILFALKELMDAPGFSFICAFDPNVVGKVLGRYHPGFGEGLKFLEKIIDYPRWLPPASIEGLVNLSIAEAKRFCDFVPESAIRDAVPLLPPNPRVVRQFIRLVSLLKPQVERHYDYELHWPVILEANILKIRHPRISHELLNAPSFWSSIGVISLALHGENEEEKLDAAISEHIQKSCTSLGLTPEQLGKSEQKELKALLKAICSHVALFGSPVASVSGLDEQGVAYQVNVAEAPAAVTWKEFDSFIVVWKQNQVSETAKAWIAEHGRRVERNELDVYRELLNAAVQRYAQALHQADNAFTEDEKPALVAQAASLFVLLNSLVFDLGHLGEATMKIGDAELEILVEKWARFAGASLPVHAKFWPRNEAFILKLFEQWSPDVTPLIRILSPYAGIRLRHFDGESAGELHKKLCAVALPKFARQVIAKFHEDGFVRRLIQKEEDTFDARSIIWDSRGPIWGQHRSEIFQILGKASSSRAVQANAYELLHWFVLMREGNAPGNRKSMEDLFSDQGLVDAVWNAASATPLAPRAVYRLRALPKILQQLGMKCEPPPWWQEIVATFIVPVAPSVPS